MLFEFQNVGKRLNARALPVCAGDLRKYFSDLLFIVSHNFIVYTVCKLNCTLSYMNRQTSALHAQIPSCGKPEVRSGKGTSIHTAHLLCIFTQIRAYVFSYCYIGEFVILHRRLELIKWHDKT